LTEVSRSVSIRPYREGDWTSLWPIIRAVTAAGETYVYDRDLPETRARDIWLGQPGGTVIVAEAGDGSVMGTAKAGPNQAGPGSHVATASFMVGSAFQGLGVGRALATHALGWATARGFRAMQFNAVVETNIQAVSLWQRLGFSIIGTVPAAFHHPRHGLVGLHIMHKFLVTDDSDAPGVVTGIEETRE
jgi:GNAT superfamily N-acetyltransferase